MNESLNLVEILKDCPKGIELYSPIYGLGILTKVTNRIHVKFPKEHNVKCFRLDGKVSEDGEIMLFPKGKTSWEGFQRPFVDGDIVFYNDTIAIFKEWGDETLFRTYVTKYLCCDSLIDINTPLFGKGIRKEIRFATEKEKEALFQAIKSLGSKWNAEDKTLEKLKKEKFDPKTLKAFESRVLVSNFGNWIPAVFGCYNKKYAYPVIVVGGNGYTKCIPYEGNEHLLNTSNKPSEFYRYWED